jgi:hypothetical protein
MFPHEPLDLGDPQNRNDLSRLGSDGARLGITSHDMAGFVGAAAVGWSA